MLAAFWGYNNLVEEDISQIMKLMCSEKRQSIDEKLTNIEQSVQTIFHYAMEQIEDTENLFQDKEKLDKHVLDVSDLMKSTAKYTDGAVSVYYRLSPDVMDGVEGFWLLKNDSGEFENTKVTDITQYEKDDTEHVGWFYEPIASGKEIWMNPYYNENIDLELISFVIPVFYDGRTIGVVGMDITTKLLYDNTKSVSVNDTGYAFLMDNAGNFVYHPEMQTNHISTTFNEEHDYLYKKSLLSANNHTAERYSWKDVEKRLTTQSLKNGMLFTVCITEDEIMHSQRVMVTRSAVVITLVILVSILVTVQFVKAIVKLAYTDSLTGLGNKTAYVERLEGINKRIINKEAVDFAVIVTDINDLKKVNDNYGHELGDMLIQDAAAVLKKVWKKDSYRIGGDEFAVILQNADNDKLEHYKQLFEKEIEASIALNAREKFTLQMAIGMTIYNPEIDAEYIDVFRRADAAMYEDKKLKKQKGRE